MRHSFKFLLILLLIPQFVFAQALPIRNDTPTALRDLGANLNVGRNFAVDQYGRIQAVTVGNSGGLSQSVIPISSSVGLNGVGTGLVGWVRMGPDTVETGSTTTVLNLTAHTLRVGDAIQLVSGTAGNVQAWSYVTAVATNTITISPALPATPANGDVLNILRPGPISSSGSVNATANSLAVFLDQNYQPVTASGIMKAEEALHNSGDTGVALWAVANEANATLAADGRYVGIGTTRRGEIFNVPSYNANISGSTSAIGAEDVAIAANAAGVKVILQRQDTLSTDTDVTNDGAPFKSNALGALWGQPTGGPTGGSTTYSKISTADNNSVNIKASAGTVYSIQASNINAAARYLKLYNKATAPTCGTDTPVFRYTIAASSGPTPAITFPVGASFPLGIGICIVTGITDADNTSTAASEQLVNITYN